MNIIGGYPIDISEAPWTVSVEVANGDHWCGGTILSERWVLTAAHCYFFHFQSQQLAGISFVHAGSTNQTDNSVGQRIAVDQVFLATGYSNWQFPVDHDVALLYLASPLTFNKMYNQ